ncbi:GntR family transcriptional regulator [Virgisporangium aliadipatigenens]|uniref:GntR family transcriptional regulator n=1 Tax=Virgisporangium aliadipatigenens TaxID=741659 RepID=A0A8J3YR09_9ACTN|nr:PLP-dependent aminotransferase family protein [Virgisporangium aliadipatigenens]GIJ48892.1 GntR family transcriptional regulator [Virgisporangium aliadipatigenens]
MTSEWTSSPREVLLSIDRDRPLRAQLERELRDAIRTGRLAPGQRLPSSRGLARDLGISRGLVTECYAQLRSEGYVVTRAGGDTRVSGDAGRSAAPAVVDAPRRRPRIDFRPGVPDLSSFPATEWSRAVQHVCRLLPVERHGYGDPAGSAVLRTVLAGYLGRVRAACAGAASTVICSGYQQGLYLTLHALAERGLRTVAVEDPGDAECRVLAAAVGLDAVPVPVDDDGIDVSALDATGARAVIVTPAHQSPTGVVLTPARRRALIAWAGARDGVIVEDDYDAEFRYDRSPVGALQGLAPERVVLLGSTSKSLAPALRLGWMLCPARLLDAVRERKRLVDRGAPAIDQEALAHLLDTGRYERHLRTVRRRYAQRRAALVEALNRHAPRVSLHGLAAGFHAVARLPDGLGENAVVAAAAERSIGLHGLNGFRAVSDPTAPARLVLGFGNVTVDDIHDGIATIADLLRPS